MQGFVGFPDTKTELIKLPDLFFSDLLPQIDDLAELKLTLHCFWLLNTQESDVRYLRGDHLRNDAALLRSLGSETELRSPRDRLEDALQRAVARHTLLRLEVDITATGAAGQAGKGGRAQGAGTPSQNPSVEDWYFMNTAKGRQTVALIRAGKLHELQITLPDEARLKVERPNIFVLYEQNIGMLTPLLADQLRDIEKTYAPEWITEAFTIAISRGKRHLRYIQAVLRGWETEGKKTDEDFSERAAKRQLGNINIADYADISFDKPDA